MSTPDFIDQVRKEVSFLYGSYSYINRSDEWAFAQWALQLIFPSLDSDQAFNLLARREDSSAPVHASYRDEQSGTYYLFTVRYSEGDEPARIGRGVLYQLLDFVRALKKPRTSATPPAVGTIAADVARALAADYTLCAVLVMFGEMNDALDLHAVLEQYQVDADEILVYDINQLRRLVAGMEEESDTLTVDVQFSESARHDGPVGALIGSVTTAEWRKAFLGRGQEIYDANVRTPLGLRSKINKQMTETITSRDESRFFWYYNNGITVLCKGFEELPGQPGRYRIHSPRIVNGAQTTAAILATSDPARSRHAQAAVPIRLIAALPGSTQVSPEVAAKPSVLQDLHLNIAKFTNSQNPIELPDFRSNEEVQRRLFQKFSALGWFYEHRRGQWEGFRNKGKYKVNGVFRRLTMVELAQEWFAFAGSPATAIRERLSLFEEQGHYSSIFMLTRAAEEYLLAHLLFQQFQVRLKKKIAEAKATSERLDGAGLEIPMQARYYLQVGRATKLAVAHLTALVGRALSDRVGRFDVGVARRVLPLVEDESLVERLYPELEHTLFRALDQISGDKYMTFHQHLSAPSTFKPLYEMYAYELSREEGKGRSPFAPF